jgi:hypothetical protein
MLNPSKIQVTDKILDYKTVAAKYGVTCDTPVLPTHIVTMAIKNIPCVLVNTLRCIMYGYIPTRRFDNVTVKTTDGMVIREHVCNRVQFVALSRKCPLGDITLSIAHDSEKKNPIIIDATMIKGLDKHLNSTYLCAIKQGAIIEITASIEEDTYANIRHVKHNFLSNFSREIISHDDKGVDIDTLQHIGIEYNTGNIKMIYQDVISGDDALRLAKKIITDIFNHLLAMCVEENREYFTIALDTVILRIKGDYSGILVNLLFVYIYSIDPTHTLSDSVNHSDSSLKIKNITQEEVHPLIKSAISLIIKHVDAL